MWPTTPLTRVGVVGFETDYSRITQPGAILAVRLPGIYADNANTKNVIVNTNLQNGQLSQATGFTAAFGGSTGHSRTLAPNEKVYVTQITVKHDAVVMELLTVDVTTLADGQGTRYRAELNVKLPDLDEMTPDGVKKTIDTAVADPAVASAVESKTIKLGMSPDQVKKSLGNPDKIVDLGAKQIYFYKDIKSRVSKQPGIRRAVKAPSPAYPDTSYRVIRICGCSGSLLTYGASSSIDQSGGGPPFRVR